MSDSFHKDAEFLYIRSLSALGLIRLLHSVKKVDYQLMTATSSNLLLTEFKKFSPY